MLRYPLLWSIILSGDNVSLLRSGEVERETGFKDAHYVK